MYGKWFGKRRNGEDLVEAGSDPGRDGPVPSKT
jgi:hypothetical protein